MSSGGPGADAAEWDAAGGFELGTDGTAVLVAGLDGSRTSWRGVAWAVGLARRQGARLVVVHVLTPGAWDSLAALTPTGGATVAGTAREVAEELGRQVDDAARTVGVEVEYRVETGERLTALSRVADEVHADLVVVGSSTSAGHRLVGSLAARLVRSGRWPVTVVP